MTQEKNVFKIGIAFVLGMIFWLIVLFCYLKCNPKSFQNTPLAKRSDSLLTDIKETQKEIDTLKEIDTVLVTRYKEAKRKTNTQFDTVKQYASEDLKPKLQELENLVFDEREKSDSIIDNRDSIIKKFTKNEKDWQQLHMVDSTRLTLANDSIGEVWHQVKKEKRKGFVRGFIWGFGTREVINQGINIINKVK